MLARGAPNLTACRWKTVALYLLVVLAAESHACAQSAPERAGFTLLVTAGAGVQRDAALQATSAGLAGLNVGVGGFLTDSIALLFRTSTTKVTYDLGPAGDYTQLSRVVAPTIQYWITDRINVEAGAGLGYWDSSTDDYDAAVGLLLGAGVTLVNRGRHNLQIGVEYAPVFTDPRAVHNLSVVIGYQFF